MMIPIPRALFLALLAPAGTLAADSTVWSSLEAIKDNSTALNNLIAPSWVREPQFRGTFSILQTCLLTLVACVYTAMHLNVPKKTVWQRLLATKFRWVLMALFVPELVLFVALDQFLQARRLRNGLVKLHKASGNEGLRRLPEESDINLTYAFFVVMGGLRVDMSQLRPLLSLDDMDWGWRRHFESPPCAGRSWEDGIEPVQLTPEGVLQLTAAGFWDIVVPAAKIEDKSKANTVQKGLVLLQVVWMAISSITRLVYRLPLTLLELHTMVHVVCALAMYGLWWKKPLDVHDPEVPSLTWGSPAIAYMVQTTFYGKQLRRSTLSLLDAETHIEPPQLHQIEMHDPELEPIPPPPEGHESPAEVVGDSQPNFQVAQAQAQRADRLKLTCEFLLSRAAAKSPGKGKLPVDISLLHDTAQESLIALKNAPLATQQCFCLTRNTQFTRRRGHDDRNWFISHVTLPMAPLMTSVDLSLSLAAVLMILYGGVHLSAWNYSFPSAVERIFWQVSCFVILSPSLCFLLLLVVGGLFVAITECPKGVSHTRMATFGKKWLPAELRLSRRPGSEKRDGKGCWLAAADMVCFFLLALPRLYLVVESFISLRRVPIGVYWVPAWLQAIPHA